MTPDKNGRYCSRCQKTVVDFTGYSDRDLYAFFNKNENVCGRFLNTQLKRTINIPYQPKSKLYRLSVALGLTLLFTQVPVVHGKIKISANQSLLNQIENDLNNSGLSIKGKITDLENNPIINAVVQVWKNDSVIATSITDLYGGFKLSYLLEGTYDIKVKPFIIEN